MFFVDREIFSFYRYSSCYIINITDRKLVFDSLYTSFILSKICLLFIVSDLYVGLYYFHLLKIFIKVPEFLFLFVLLCLFLYNFFFVFLGDLDFFFFHHEFFV